MSKLSQRKPSSQTGPQIEVRPFDGLVRIQPHAAGLDIGAHEIMVCVPGPDNTQIVRTFGTYTADLHDIAQWLLGHGIQSVAMESTGVYWIPLFETLETYGFQCCLIAATAIKRFPGRKTDVLDCQWIQTLHSYGLLADSFRPEADLVALRTLLRHRAQLIQHRSPHILHMQKALLHMNIQLSQVLSDITGETGQHIIRAIVAGERDPHKLATLRNYRCKKDEAEIAKALTGTWREEHLFVLRQSLAFFDFYTWQIEACDEEIERTYAAIRPDWGNPDPEDQPPLPSKKPRSHSKNTPKNVQVRNHLKRIAGVDIASLCMASVLLWPKLSSRRLARTCPASPPRRTSVPGWVWHPTTTSPGGKSSAAGRSRPITGRDRLSARRQLRSSVRIVPSGLSTAASRAVWVRLRPLSPLPTRLHGLSTTC